MAKTPKSEKGSGSNKKRKGDDGSAIENEDDISSIETAGSYESLLGRWDIKPIDTDKIGGDFQVWTNRWVVLAAQFVSEHEGQKVKKLDKLKKQFADWTKDQKYFDSCIMYDKLYFKDAVVENRNRNIYRDAVLDCVLTYYTNKDAEFTWEWRDDVLWYYDKKQFFVEFPQSKDELKVMERNQ